MAEIKLPAKADYLFELSWEVCNKVGGINTVLKTKAPLMTERYQRYVLIGPYFERNATLELEPHEPPAEIAAAIKELAEQGIMCKFGTWQIKGEPDAILIDSSSLIAKKDELKSWLWEKYKVDSLGAGWDYDEPIIFCAAAAKLLAAIEKRLPEKKLVAHCHEWMAGATLLFLKGNGSRIKTTFTTHATMLGRAISGDGGNLYEELDTMDPIQRAYYHRVQAKHLTEVACARECSTFTTVSEITGMEAQKLLGRKPDVLVLNGLDISKFPTFEETSIKHLTCREKLREFLAYYFYPYYAFPIEHNIMMFITGRFEFKNKGIDLTIKALGRLNELLKADATPRTVTVFFWIPMGSGSVRMDLLENKNYYTHIRNYIHYNSDAILKKVLYDFLSHKDLTSETLFTKDFMQGMKKDILQFKRPGNPPLATNYLTDEQNNEAIRAFYANGLDNRQENPVKVIIQPVYLDGNDGLHNLSYYDAIAGTHLGLFPSYYEPWGYTPLETAAMGVSAVTTDLAGFGLFIEPHIDDEHPGIRVLHRFKRPEHDVVEDFAQLLFRFARLSHAERVQNKLAAKTLAAMCDWDKFIEFYVEAHNKALEK